MTRGRICQQEVELGARYRRRAAVAGAEQKGSSGGQRRKKADRSQKDSFVNPKNSRDPSVN
jgi:hypothetical protein